MIYEYRALTQSGKTIRGIIDAAALEGAHEKLKSRGLFIQELTEMKRGGSALFRSFSFTRRKTKAAQITRQLSFLLSAHMPVINALDGVIEQIDDEELKKIMIEIREKLKEGKSLSQAFSEYPDYFSRMYVSSLHAGEVSGTLGTVFARLSDMHEKNQALISKLRSSLTYPVLLLVFACIIIIFLISFIVPTFARLFEEFGQVLPLPTRILIGISGLLKTSWWILLIIIGAGVLVLHRLYRRESVKLYFDHLVLKLPVVKRVLTDTFKIRFAYTMSLMLSNGIGIIEALQNTMGVFKNRVFSGLLDRAVELIKKGERLSRALSHSELFNAALLGMIHAGEMSDSVPEVLESIAHNIEVELGERITTLTTLAEPVLIMIIGSIVAFTVLSIMLPIFQINQMFG